VAKVYAREKGHEYRIGNFGTVTHDRPVIVPPAIAEELSGIAVLRVESDEPPPTSRKKSETPAPVAEKE
jgi:hypothetical protein